MKYHLTTFLALSTVGSAIGGNVPSCEDAFPCLDISITKIEGSADICDLTGCAFHYKMSITVDSSLCDKGSENISHVCWQDGSDMTSQCPVADPSEFYWFPSEAGKGSSNFTTNYLIPPGGVVYFGTKDGGGCDLDEASFTVDVMNSNDDLTVTCFGQEVLNDLEGGSPVVSNELKERRTDMQNIVERTHFLFFCL